MNLRTLLAGDDDYRAIARAVQGPMQRWWRGIGIWWSVAALVLIGSILLQISLTVQRSSAGQLPGPPTNLEQMLELVHWLTAPLVALMWVLAAQRALAALEALAGSGGLEFSDNRMVGYRFRLVLWQALVPVVLTASYLTVLELRFMLPLFGSDLWSTADNLQMIASTGIRLLSGLISFAFLAAMLAVPQVPRWLVWLWYLAIFGGWLNNLFFFTAMQLNFEFPFLTAQMDMLIVEEVSAALQIAGLGLVLLSLRLIALQQEGGYRLAAFIGILGTLAVWRAGLGSQPQDIGSVAYDIDYALALLYKLPMFNQLFGLTVLDDAGLTLLIFVLDYRFEIRIDQWLFWVGWPVQAAITAGYLWLIHFVITRGATGPAAAGQKAK